MRYVKLFEGSTKHLDGTSMATIRTFVLLLKYLDKHNDFRGYDGKLLTMKDIVEITGYSPMTVKRTMVELVSHRVIERRREDKSYVYHMNTRIAKRGEE